MCNNINGRRLDLIIIIITSEQMDNTGEQQQRPGYGKILAFGNSITNFRPLNILGGKR